MLHSSLSMKRESDQNNGHSSGLDHRKSGTLLVKTVQKENGTKLQRKWCWHSQKADIQSSESRVHCPEECLKAKVVENCRYTILRRLWNDWIRTLISVNMMQDSWLLLRSDSISWRKTLKNSHNSQIQWLVVSTPCQEAKIHLNQKVESEGTPKLGPYWKLQPVVYKVNMERK